MKRKAINLTLHFDSKDEGASIEITRELNTPAHVHTLSHHYKYTKRRATMAINATPRTWDIKDLGIGQPMIIKDWN